MDVFKNDDDSYLAWHAGHEEAFVLNRFGGINSGHNVLHHSTCAFLWRDADENARTVVEKWCSASEGELAEHADSALSEGMWKRCSVCFRSDAIANDKTSPDWKEVMNVQSEVPDDLLITGMVQGTPRTYGDRKNDDVWRTEIGNGDWSGISGEPLRISVHLNFDFRVNPRSPRYGGNASPNGPDIDTMVIGALDGLVCQRTDRPTMRMIENRGLCRLVTASKPIVDSDNATGLTLQVRAADIVSTDLLRENGEFSFCVTRDNVANKAVRAKDRIKVAVQQAAESANHNKFRAPYGTRIHICLAFADGLTRNPLSADWLEAVIDGLGASRVGEQRFFDGPPTSDFGYNDTVVYGLTCCQVKGLPENVELRVVCNRLPDVSE